MHYIFLVEDRSGMVMLQDLAPRIAGPEDSFEFHPYRGVGHLPPGLSPAHAGVKTLLNKLPGLLRAFQTQFMYVEHRIVVVCDLDRNEKSAFLQALDDVTQLCDARNETLFCVAIEEGEAWLLGDREAVLAAYPRAKKRVLDTYEQDSICGTWEKLADAIHPGGSKALNNFMAAGKAKAEWAARITPHMVPERNVSPSFQHFVHALRGARW